MSATISTSLVPASITPHPLKAARASLISEFLGMFMPNYPVNPSPSDHESMARHILDVAMMFDRYLAAVGSEVRDNAVTQVSSGLFAGTFLGAVDGNETWACEEQASALKGFAAERRRA